MDQASLGAGHQLVVFRVDSHWFALRLLVVERVLPMVAISPLPGAPKLVLGAINVHGRVLAVLDLRRRLALPEREYGPEAQLLVVRARQRVLALPVDEVAGVRRVVSGTVTTPDDAVPGLALVTGLAPLEDGVLVIHDLDAFFSADEELALDRAVAGMQT